MKHIYYSYSQCVADIYHGKITLDDVHAIISGTHSSDGEKLIDAYINDHWRAISLFGKNYDAVKVGEIGVAVFKSHKMVQPRCDNNPYKWNNDMNHSFTGSGEPNVVLDMAKINGDEKLKMAYDALMVLYKLSE